MSDKDALSDESLWERMLRKDEEAVALLYLRYFDSLYNYGMHLCSDEEVVKDCIQDLFLSFYSLHSSSSVRSVKAYLLASVRNNILKNLKHSGVHIAMDEVEFELAVSEEDVLCLFGDDDVCCKKVQRLHQAYRQLSANQRHAIYLRFIKELDWEEAGEVLHISSHSCMNLVGRAVAKLRKLMLLF